MWKFRRLTNATRTFEEDFWKMDSKTARELLGSKTIPAVGQV
jgi:hypothetical protein